MKSIIKIYHWIAAPVGKPTLKYTWKQMCQYNDEDIINFDIIYNTKFKLFKLVSNKISLSEAKDILILYKENLSHYAPGKTMKVHLQKNF